jgi:hypothetical protein
VRNSCQAPKNFEGGFIDRDFREKLCGVQVNNNLLTETTQLTVKCGFLLHKVVRKQGELFIEATVQLFPQ